MDLSLLCLLKKQFLHKITPYMINGIYLTPKFGTQRKISAETPLHNNKIVQPMRWKSSFGTLNTSGLKSNITWYIRFKHQIDNFDIINKYIVKCLDA